MTPPRGRNYVDSIPTTELLVDPHGAARTGRRKVYNAIRTFAC